MKSVRFFLSRTGNSAGLGDTKVDSARKERVHVLVRRCLRVSPEFVLMQNRFEKVWGPRGHLRPNVLFPTHLSYGIFRSVREFPRHCLFPLVFSVAACAMSNSDHRTFGSPPWIGDAASVFKETFEAPIAPHLRFNLQNGVKQNVLRIAWATNCLECRRRRRWQPLKSDKHAVSSGFVQTQKPRNYSRPPAVQP